MTTKVLQRTSSGFNRYYSTKSQKKSSTDYCLNLVRKNDYENFLCTLLLPQPARSAAIAIRAFNVEVSKAASSSTDTRIAQMRLQFWKDTLDRIYDGKPPEQPVAIELAKVVSKHNLKKRQLLRLVKARESQLTEPCFQSLAKMESYSEETVSPVIYLTLEIAGVKDIHADHVASHIGKGHGLAILLRVAASGGSWSLPKDLMDLCGLPLDKGLRPVSSASRDIAFKIASQAKSHIDKARSLKSTLPSASRAHFLLAVPTYKYLHRLRDSNFDVYDPILQSRDFQLGFSLFWSKLISSF